MRSLKISGTASRSRSNLAKFNPHHDSNGRFASGGAGGGAGLSVEEDLKNFDPNAPVPASPKNAGGVDAKTWDNWEHGVDGNQYVDLYRQHVGEKLGLDVPKSDLAPGGQLNYLTQRGFGGSSNETAQKQAESMVTAIANGTPNQPALYRGIVASATDPDSQALVKQFTNLRPGDTVDMPLVSTTRSLGVASWYAADRVASGTDSVLIKIQPGAKGISQSAKNSWYPADHEVVTSGKFEVVGVSKVQAPYWSRGVFEPRKIQYTDGSAPHFEVATYNKIRYSPAEAEHIWNTVKSGNIQSLATDTLKFTDDRKIGFGNTDRLVYSSWSKQAPKNFTVVEVKMIEPHVIQKAADFGLDFDLLFGGRPFIDDSVPVIKYNSNHDSAGRFASGGAGGGGTGTGVIGGPGKDITKKLEDVFFEKGTKRLVRNAETEKIRDDMKAQNQKNGSGQEDTALVIIAQKQGFDGKPKLVETQADLMEVQSKEGGLLVYRGIADYAQNGEQVTLTGARGADELRSGDYHAGFGVYGNGIYSTTQIDAAVAYANMKDDAYDRRGNGVTVAMLIPQTALRAPRDVVRETVKSVADRVSKDTSMNAHQSNDLGRALASKGYQYYDAGSVHGKGSGVFVILDRSMLTVAKENL